MDLGLACQTGAALHLSLQREGTSEVSGPSVHAQY